MMQHSLRHAVKIRADHAKVREALTTASGLATWTFASVSNEGAQGEWTFNHADGPTFVWKITQPDAHTVHWKCIEGPGNAAGTTATFKLNEEADGRICLTMEHAGWPHQEGNFDKCNSLWGMLLHQLRECAECGARAAPSH